jgi:hypothetical protein
MRCPPGVIATFSTSAGERPALSSWCATRPTPAIRQWLHRQAYSWYAVLTLVVTTFVLVGVQQTLTVERARDATGQADRALPGVQAQLREHGVRDRTRAVLRALELPLVGTT